MLMGEAADWKLVVAFPTPEQLFAAVHRVLVRCQHIECHFFRPRFSFAGRIKSLSIFQPARQDVRSSPGINVDFRKSADWGMQ